jgi:ATP-binding cassette subfamily B protein
MTSTQALRRLVPFLQPYRTRLAIGLFLVVLSSAFSTVIPWLVRRAIDAMTAGAPVRNVYVIGATMVGLALLAGGLRYGMREIMNGVSRWVEYDLRNALFAHLETVDAAYFARMRTGDVMARLTNDLSAVRMAAGPAIMYFANTVFGGAFALVFMLRISPRLTAFALLPMVLLPVVAIKLGRMIHERFESVQEHFSRVTTLAQENLAGVRVVRAYRQERAEERRFAELNAAYLDKNMRLVRLQAAMNPSFGLFAGLGALSVLGLGGMLALRGAITIGEFVAFSLYLSILTWPLIALGWVVNLFQRGAASMERLTHILDAEPTIVSPAEPRALPPRRGAGRTVEFRGVGYHYPTEPGREPRWVLRDVSFVVPAGATLGIVGATGSGKSTLIDLIPRIHDPQEGEVLVDGVPVAALALGDLRREIGYVPQESLLFSDTIAANLRYGTEDDEDARWAARVARIDEQIAAFPAGYETMLGERGINLSGGQKQRASLARALARRPSVVLLDDALSAVDTQTEAEILHALSDALSRQTAVIASHRISAVRDADLIIVLDEGCVVERGTHAELIARRGRYWALLRRQQLVEQIEGDGDEVEAPSDADAPGDVPHASVLASDARRD